MARVLDAICFIWIMTLTVTYKVSNNLIKVDR